MESMCAQTRPRFILSSERVLGNGVRTRVNPKGKIPSPGGSEEGRTRDSASRSTASPKHYQLSYSGLLKGLAKSCHFTSEYFPALTEEVDRLDSFTRRDILRIFGISRTEEFESSDSCAQNKMEALNDVQDPPRLEHRRILSVLTVWATQETADPNIS